MFWWFLYVFFCLFFPCQAEIIRFCKLLKLPQFTYLVFGSSILGNHQHKKYRGFSNKCLCLQLILNSVQPWRLICSAWWEKSLTKICADTWFCLLWEALLTKHLPALLILPDCWIFLLFICLLPSADFFCKFSQCCHMLLPAIRQEWTGAASRGNWIMAEMKKNVTISFLLKHNLFFSAGDMELKRIAPWNNCGTIQMDSFSANFLQKLKHKTSHSSHINMMFNEFLYILIPRGKWST